MRAVSVLEVAAPALWAELAAEIDLEAHTAEELDPTRRVVKPSFEREALPRLGDLVLVRYARRDPRAVAHARQDLALRIDALPPEARRILFTAQRHALGDEVIGLHAWDPALDAEMVRRLRQAELLEALTGEDGEPTGRFRLHRDLPPPPEIAYDFTDAVMDETEDLPKPLPGPIGLLHDLASLAAAIDHISPHRTHAGTIARADARRLGRRLAAPDLAEDGLLEQHPRWGRSLRALDALGVVALEPLSRELHLDLGLDTALSGDTVDAVDRLVHRLLDRDLHVVLPAVRTALRQAGEGAIDEVVFLDLLREQHRDVLFPRWQREGIAIYPMVAGEAPRLYDDDGFERFEGSMIDRVLTRAEHLGLLRRAPGVFAGTTDGRRWAGAATGPRAPVWISSDLEVIVPPHAITPWERFQLERLGRCLARDVVDRYKLERAGLVRWLATHDLDEAFDLLRRRCSALPRNVEETLAGWARSAQRIVLTRGVLLPR